MLGPQWLLRMSRWARNPPSWQRVLLVLGVIALCLLLFAVEYFGAWPDWLKVNGRTPIRIN